ncbi:MAG TPA: DUF6482 family protein [Pseudomonadales bacterium]|nr:DUF6482 family protein [Pseudomonadales bacterium]
MTLSELKRSVAAGARPQPEIHSIEGLVYVVHVGDDVLTPSRDTRALRFPSLFAASQALGRIGIERGWLVHASPYDEMIGRHDEGMPPPQPLRTPVAFPQDAASS